MRATDCSIRYACGYLASSASYTARASAYFFSLRSALARFISPAMISFGSSAFLRMVSIGGILVISLTGTLM